MDFKRKANDYKRKIRSYITTRTILLMLVQAFIIANYYIPWTTFYKTAYTPIFIFNNFFTYTEFISFGYFFTYIFLISTIITGLLNLVKPRLVGIVNLSWGLVASLIVVFYSIMVIRTGFIAGISIGPFVIMICGIIQLYLNKWFSKKENEIINQSTVKTDNL